MNKGPERNPATCAAAVRPLTTTVTTVVSKHAKKSQAVPEIYILMVVSSCRGAARH